MDITEVNLVEPQPIQDIVLELLVQTLKEFSIMTCQGDQCINCGLSNICDDLEKLIPKVRSLIPLPRDEADWL